MKGKTILTIFVLFLTNFVFSQNTPEIRIKYSKLLATYDFVKQLSNNYPDSKYKQVFITSEFNTKHYIDLINQLDTLNIYESYKFQDYPVGQKQSLMTTSLIERNLINSNTITAFKKETFGIIPTSVLLPFSNIIAAFEPVYNQLIYQPNKNEFESQLSELKNYVKNENLAYFFEKGLTFYNTKWDESIPIDIAIIPSIKEGGFSASATLDIAISEIPLGFKQNDILFSVLMHELYHSVYNEQSLEVKQNIDNWFNNNPSKNSQYAYLLLNEALATAFGNGYVLEQLNGVLDKEDWYYNKYINLMGKEIYPLLKEYIDNNKAIDKTFVDEYIRIYDNNFSSWLNELDNLMINRYLITDNPNDFNYFRENYSYSSFSISEFPFTQMSLEQMKETPITKIIIVSSDNQNKLKLIKNTFNELKNWKFSAQKEFVYTTKMKDKTKLIIINQHKSPIDEIFNKNFKDKTCTK